MPDTRSTEYINSIEYKKLEDKIKELKNVIEDKSSKLEASRKLRYAEVDIEAEREAGRFQPDELYVPQKIIDTNIRREQSPYVQYITQSPRAVVCDDLDDSTVDMSVLETDLTKKLRYDCWQLSLFANIDSFQQNGYGVMEVIQDQNNPGHVAHEMLTYGDFAFISDTRDLQQVEMTARTYYFTRTRLVQLCGNGDKPDEDFNKVQVDKIFSKAPSVINNIESSEGKDSSLYPIYKIMFRVNGVVHVAWTCPETCDDWVRLPRPLFIGRRKITQQAPPMAVPMGQPPMPQSEEAYETNYPYIVFPYLISENDTVDKLKGRVFLDQDLQEAVSSLVSSTVTQARRASGLYFSKDVSDPNDDLLLQKNIFFKSGCLINAKVQKFQLDAPDPGMFSAINMLVTANQNETSQVNFAVQNRKDSRKTAKEISVAEQQTQQLSTVQVVLFSIALTQLYRLMTSIIKSRVIAGIINVGPTVMPYYQRNFTVKPSGDTDVIERQQLITKMMNTWTVLQNTAAGPVFLADLLKLLFPDRADKYIAALQQGMQQQQSQQNQQMQQLASMFDSMAKGITHLASKPEMFSETGRIHALPAIENAANQLKQLQANGQQRNQ